MSISIYNPRVLISADLPRIYGKGDTLRWTEYADECLHIIETEKEFVSDTLLVQLVKLRLVSESATRAPWSGEISNLTGPPAMFYLRSLEAQLQDFKSNIPSELNS